MSDAPATARPAATIILIRRGCRHSERGLEILLVRRAESQSFMPGVWVFPGGAVEEDESPETCAVRELEEEAGVALERSTAVLPWMRWVTPEVVPVRFDTLFFVALGPPHAELKPDQREVDDAGWFAPAQALERHRAGEIELVFPTIKTLETLLPFESAEEVLAAAPERSLEPVLPKVIGTREDYRIVLPWEEGYDDATDPADLKS